MIRKGSCKTVKASVMQVYSRVVIGAENFLRGRTSDASTSKADQIGMLATVMNCIYVYRDLPRNADDTLSYPF